MHHLRAPLFEQARLEKVGETMLKGRICSVGESAVIRCAAGIYAGHVMYGGHVIHASCICRVPYYGGPSGDAPRQECTCRFACLADQLLIMLPMCHLLLLLLGSTVEEWPHALQAKRNSRLAASTCSLAP